MEYAYYAAHGPLGSVGFTLIHYTVHTPHVPYGVYAE